MTKATITNLWKGFKYFEPVIAEFRQNTDRYLYSYELKVNGKSRRIITYKDNKDGADLRLLHELSNMAFRKMYKSSNASHAYKKKQSIHTCLQEHIHSDVFLKADIHAYFDCVKKDVLLDKILALSKAENKKKNLKALLETCFYQDHMPIGLITSPVLSDLYLNEIDHIFEKKEGIVYTRYADDFIISSTGDDAELRLTKTLEELTEKLEELGLSLNKRKTYIRRLNAPGDAIHLLGLNLVYVSPGENRITVSNRFIRQTSMEYCEYLAKKDSMDKEARDLAFAAVYGKISFILDSSKSSAKKLQRMLAVKTGCEFALTRAALK